MNPNFFKSDIIKDVVNIIKDVLHLINDIFGFKFINYLIDAIDDLMNPPDHQFSM